VIVACVNHRWGHQAYAGNINGSTGCMGLVVGVEGARSGHTTLWTLHSMHICHEYSIFGCCRSGSFRK
jgi:hypothetical protein